MRKELRNYEIEIAVEENDEWHKTKVQIVVDGLTDRTDIETMITEKATVWASDNGYNYRTWDYISQGGIETTACYLTVYVANPDKPWATETTSLKGYIYE